MFRKFSALILFSALLFCKASYGDVFYISSNKHSINRITSGLSEVQNALPELEASKYENIFSFTHDGHNRLFITQRDEENFYAFIYDAENLSVPLVSKDLSLWGIAGIDTLSELDNNILLAGEKYSAPAAEGSNVIVRDGFIAELNPETLELAGEIYTFFDAQKFGAIYSPESYMNYDIDVWFMEVYAYAHKNIIYASREESTILETGAGSLFELSIMNKSGNITGKIHSPVHLNKFVSSGSSLYVSTKHPYYNVGTINPDIVNPQNFDFFSDLGIYRIEHDRIQNELQTHSGDFELADYSEHVITDTTGSIYPDGEGGLFYTTWEYYTLSNDEVSYVLTDSNERYIYHWDGSRSERVYDAGEAQNLSGLEYDTGLKVVFTSLNGNITAINQSGQSQVFGEAKDFAVVNMPSATDDENQSNDIKHTPNDENKSDDVEPDSNDKNNSNDIIPDTETQSEDIDPGNGGGSSSGGCNSGFCIFAAIVLLKLFIKR